MLAHIYLYISVRLRLGLFLVKQTLFVSFFQFSFVPVTKYIIITYTTCIELALIQRIKRQ